MTLPSRWRVIDSSLDIMFDFDVTATYDDPIFRVECEYFRIRADHNNSLWHVEVRYTSKKNLYVRLVVPYQEGEEPAQLLQYLLTSAFFHNQRDVLTVIPAPIQFNTDPLF